MLTSYTKDEDGNFVTVTTILEVDDATVADGETLVVPYGGGLDASTSWDNADGSIVSAGENVRTEYLVAVDGDGTIGLLPDADGFHLVNRTGRTWGNRTRIVFTARYSVASSGGGNGGGGGSGPGNGNADVTAEDLRDLRDEVQGFARLTITYIPPAEDGTFTLRVGQYTDTYAYTAGQSANAFASYINSLQEIPGTPEDYRLTAKATPSGNGFQIFLYSPYDLEISGASVIGIEDTETTAIGVQDGMTLAEAHRRIVPLEGALFEDGFIPTVVNGAPADGTDTATSLFEIGESVTFTYGGTDNGIPVDHVFTVTFAADDAAPDVVSPTGKTLQDVVDFLAPAFPYSIFDIAGGTFRLTVSPGVTAGVTGTAASALGFAEGVNGPTTGPVDQLGKVVDGLAATNQRIAFDLSPIASFRTRTLAPGFTTTESGVITINGAAVVINPGMSVFDIQQAINAASLPPPDEIGADIENVYDDDFLYVGTLLRVYKPALYGTFTYLEVASENPDLLAELGIRVRNGQVEVPAPNMQIVRLQEEIYDLRMRLSALEAGV